CNRAAEIRWQSTRRRREIPEIPSAECSDLFLRSGKPDEFALGRPIMVGIDQRRRGLLIGHSGCFEGIANENRREIAHHLIKTGDCLRSYRQEVRAAKK